MLLDLLFPNRCLECNIIIGDDALVCEACLPKLPFTHINLNENNILKQRCQLLFPVEYAYALLNYDQDGLARKIIHALKYRSREKVGKMLAEWTFDRLNLQSNIPDLIVSIPLHPRKMKERGYNQLDLFAETLSRHTHIPYEKGLTKRNYYSKPQALKDKSHRDKTQNLFSLNRPLDNQHVLIVDDVFTTGNTMSSMAWEILNAGNNKVSVLVMAID